MLLSDLQGRRLDTLARLPQALVDATGTFLLFTTPSGTWVQPGGQMKCLVCFIVIDNPTGGAPGGAVTCSFGSTSTSTDFRGSASLTLPAAGAAVIVPLLNAGLLYQNGVVFNFKITTTALAAASAADITVLGNVI